MTKADKTAERPSRTDGPAPSRVRGLPMFVNTIPMIEIIVFRQKARNESCEILSESAGQQAMMSTGIEEWLGR